MNTFFCILAVIIGASCISAQQSCPSVTITQTLRTTWQNSGVATYLYDLTVANAYAEQVSNIVFVIESSTGVALSTAAGSAVTSTWNAQLLGSTQASKAEFTLVEDGAVHSLSVAAGSTYTAAGYIVSGTPTTISGTVTCTRSVSSSTASGATTATTATTSSVATSSTAAAAASSTGSVPSSTTGSVSSAECTTLLVSIQSEGQTWTDSTNEYLQYSVSVTNTGSQAATSALTTIYFTTAYGYVSDMWNMNLVAAAGSDDGTGNSFEMTLYNLAPGQTFTGVGFVFAESLVHITEGHQGHYDFPYDAVAKSVVCSA